VEAERARSLLKDLPDGARRGLPPELRSQIAEDIWEEWLDRNSGEISSSGDHIC
jgi:hypothetical protein